MVVTSDPQIERKLRLLRNQGMLKQYENEMFGLNNRITDVAAAVGRVQLAKLGRWTERRREIAAAYHAGLTSVSTPSEAADAFHVYHQYTVRVGSGRERDAFRAALADRGVGSGVYYPTPIHRLPSFGRDLELPETERAAHEVLSLPVQPSLTGDEVDRVVEAVNAL
jgi:dTDP-4-amino-4,6-dideoxygalactose transaminase